MKRITKEPWFAPRSKELKWIKREAPITWQGWAFAILFFSIIVILFLYVLFYSSTWNSLIMLSICGNWIPYRLVVTLTSDNPFYGNVDDQRASGVSSAEISRKLNEKRNN